jgi:E3 SUMO-protein ligase PIAS1
MMLPLRLPQAYVNHLRTDSTLRILLYCAAGDVPKNTEADITFPAQLEIKVGGEEVKANFKGLKNKPGSTRPADITGFIKREPDFSNQIHVTYALTHKVVIFIYLHPSLTSLIVRLMKNRFLTSLHCLSGSIPSKSSSIALDYAA